MELSAGPVLCASDRRSAALTLTISAFETEACNVLRGVVGRGRAPLPLREGCGVELLRWARDNVSTDPPVRVYQKGIWTDCVPLVKASRGQESQSSMELQT